MDSNKIPLAVPSIDDAEIQAVTEVLQSGWLTHGPYNKKFEELFSEKIGVKNAICMNSCTSALEIALKANNISGEVIVPSFTFVASANSIVNAGAVPVFCDCDLKTRNVTAAHLEEVLSPDTEAVMLVHYGGQCCPMDEICAFCEKHDLLLVEDSAETIGGTWDGKQAGSFGIGCFSFFPTKNITTGEGGMLTCQDDDLFARVKQLIAHGISTQTIEREEVPRPWQREAVIAGHNFRLSNLLAAIGYHQMQKLDSMNLRRRELASLYNKYIKELSLPVEIPYENERAFHVYQMYTIRVDKKIRDALVLHLRKTGVGASVHFDPPAHLQKFYEQNYKPKASLKNSEELSNSLITMPIFPSMTDEQVEHSIKGLADFFKGQA